MQTKRLAGKRHRTYSVYKTKTYSNFQELFAEQLLKKLLINLRDAIILNHFHNLDNNDMPIPTGKSTEAFVKADYAQLINFLDQKDITYRVLEADAVGSVVAENINAQKSSFINLVLQKANVNTITSGMKARTVAFISPPGYGKTAGVKATLERLKEEKIIADFIVHDMMGHNPISSPFVARVASGGETTNDKIEASSLEALSPSETSWMGQQIFNLYALSAYYEQNNSDTEPEKRILDFSGTENESFINFIRNIRNKKAPLISVTSADINLSYIWTQLYQLALIIVYTLLLIVLQENVSRDFYQDFSERLDKFIESNESFFAVMTALWVYVIFHVIYVSDIIKYVSKSDELNNRSKAAFDRLIKIFAVLWINFFLNQMKNSSGNNKKLTYLDSLIKEFDSFVYGKDSIEAKQFLKNIDEADFKNEETKRIIGGVAILSKKTDGVPYNNVESFLNKITNDIFGDSIQNVSKAINTIEPLVKFLNKVTINKVTTDTGKDEKIRSVMVDFGNIAAQTVVGPKFHENIEYEEYSNKRDVRRVKDFLDFVSENILSLSEFSYNTFRMVFADIYSIYLQKLYHISYYQETINYVQAICRNEKPNLSENAVAKISIAFPSRVSAIINKAFKAYGELVSQAEKGRVDISTLQKKAASSIYVVFLDEFFHMMNPKNQGIIPAVWNGLYNKDSDYPPNLVLILAGNAPAPETFSYFLNQKTLFHPDISEDSMKAFFNRLNLHVLMNSTGFLALDSHRMAKFGVLEPRASSIQSAEYAMQSTEIKGEKYIIDSLSSVALYDFYEKVYTPRKNSWGIQINKLVGKDEEDTQLIRQGAAIWEIIIQFFSKSNLINRNNLNELIDKNHINGLTTYLQDFIVKVKNSIVKKENNSISESLKAYFEKYDRQISWFVLNHYLNIFLIVAIQSIFRELPMYIYTFLSRLLSEGISGDVKVLLNTLSKHIPSLGQIHNLPSGESSALEKLKEDENTRRIYLAGFVQLYIVMVGYVYLSVMRVLNEKWFVGFLAAGDMDKQQGTGKDLPAPSVAISEAEYNSLSITLSQTDNGIKRGIILADKQNIKIGASGKVRLAIAYFNGVDAWIEKSGLSSELKNKIKVNYEINHKDGERGKFSIFPFLVVDDPEMAKALGIFYNLFLNSILEEIPQNINQNNIVEAIYNTYYVINEKTNGILCRSINVRNLGEYINSAIKDYQGYLGFMGLMNWLEHVLAHENIKLAGESSVNKEYSNVPEYPRILEDTQDKGQIKMNKDQIKREIKSLLYALSHNEFQSLIYGNRNKYTWYNPIRDLREQINAQNSFGTRELRGLIERGAKLSAQVNIDIIGNELRSISKADEQGGVNITLSHLRQRETGYNLSMVLLMTQHLLGAEVNILEDIRSSLDKYIPLLNQLLDEYTIPSLIHGMKEAMIRRFSIIMNTESVTMSDLLKSLLESGERIHEEGLLTRQELTDQNLKRYVHAQIDTHSKVDRPEYKLRYSTIKAIYDNQDLYKQVVDILDKFLKTMKLYTQEISVGPEQEKFIFQVLVVLYTIYTRTGTITEEEISDTIRQMYVTKESSKELKNLSNFYEEYLMFSDPQKEEVHPLAKLLLKAQLDYLKTSKQDYNNLSDSIVQAIKYVSMGTPNETYTINQIRTVVSNIINDCVENELAQSDYDKNLTEKYNAIIKNIRQNGLLTALAEISASLKLSTINNINTAKLIGFIFYHLGVFTMILNKEIYNALFKTKTKNTDSESEMQNNQKQTNEHPMTSYTTHFIHLGEIFEEYNESTFNNNQGNNLNSATNNSTKIDIKRSIIEKVNGTEASIRIPTKIYIDEDKNIVIFNNCIPVQMGDNVNVISIKDSVDNVRNIMLSFRSNTWYRFNYLMNPIDLKIIYNVYNPESINTNEYFSTKALKVILNIIIVMHYAGIDVDKQNIDNAKQHINDLHQFVMKASDDDILKFMFGMHERNSSTGSSKYISVHPCYLSYLILASEKNMADQLHDKLSRKYSNISSLNDNYNGIAPLSSYEREGGDNTGSDAIKYQSNRNGIRFYNQQTTSIDIAQEESAEARLIETSYRFKLYIVNPMETIMEKVR